MSQQDSRKVTVKDGHLVCGEKPLYMCTVHKSCGELPFYVPGDRSWGDLADWICQWEPILVELSSDDEDISKDLKKTLARRPKPDDKQQATFRDYQLYTFSGDENAADPQGEVQGFWELVTLKTSCAEEDRKNCSDSIPTPPNARGP